MKIGTREGLNFHDDLGLTYCIKVSQPTNNHGVNRTNSHIVNHTRRYENITQSTCAVPYLTGRRG